MKPDVLSSLLAAAELKAPRFDNHLLRAIHYRNRI